MSNDFLEVDDLSVEQLESVLSRAIAWKAQPSLVARHLDGQGVAILFEKPSARTRTSTEMAVFTLGGHPIYIRPEEVGLDTRETVEDVARTLSGYCRIVAARTFAHCTLERMAAVIDRPVINLLSDGAHPCQAVADVLTLREQWGALEGRRIAYIGDGNNVAASLAYAATLTGMAFAIASPEGFELPDTVVARVRSLGGTIDMTNDPRGAASGSDALYTDVWTSMGQESERGARLTSFQGFQVDADLMDAAKPGAVFMHCLPAHRGEEVSAEVMDGPHSMVWPQAANRMDAVRSVMVELLEAV